MLSYAVLDIAQNHIASQQRWESIQSHLSAQGTCLEVCDCGLEAQTVQQQCQKLLSTYGKDLEIVFCADDAQVAGVLAAVEDGGRKAGEDIYIIGTNATGQTKNLVKQGKLTGTLAADTTLAATRVVQLLRSRGEVLYLDAYVAVAAENVNGDNA
jgi:methyl-galactoside transport system substrate-binding protein